MLGTTFALLIEIISALKPLLYLAYILPSPENAQWNG